MRITGILFALLLAGCASAPSFETWQGASRDEVVLAYGVPTAETHLSGGGSMIEYHRKPFGDNSQFHCTTRFVLGSDGTVQSGSIKGNYSSCTTLARQ